MSSRSITEAEAFLRPLAQTDLFHDFTAAELATLAASARPRAFREGQVIFHRDDPGTGFYVVRYGLVKISIVAPDGQETLVSLLGPGEPFGEMAILDGQPRSATATAMERTETIYVSREGFLRFLDEHPAAMRKIMVMLIRRLRAATEHLADLVFHDVYGRLAKKLLELGELHGRAYQDGRVEIQLALTQQDLANLVGASRESVNKVMKLYRDKGYIAVQSHRITLLQPRELQRRVELG
ncbi:MAG TPA: Crp/Fnr family transcriptional regulator [Chloroflexota bacterium]|nr:Crp/Fnr family transcriptional regulator [Chloroflexota bacterium]